MCNTFTLRQINKGFFLFLPLYVGQHCPDPQSNSLTQGLVKQQEAPESTAAEWISAAWFYCCMDTAMSFCGPQECLPVNKNWENKQVAKTSLKDSRSKGKDLLQAQGSLNLWVRHPWVIEDCKLALRELMLPLLEKI